MNVGNFFLLDTRITVAVLLVSSVYRLIVFTTLKNKLEGKS
ncbi:MAG: hypothetical protein ACP5UA_08070 [Candidatus Hydrogenedens sp.]